MSIRLNLCRSVPPEFLGFFSFSSSKYPRHYCCCCSHWTQTQTCLTRCEHDYGDTADDDNDDADASDDDEDGDDVSDDDDNDNDDYYFYESLKILHVCKLAPSG